MLQFILGRSGCGKTTTIIKEITKEVKNGRDGKILYLVPEQNSFEMEKAMFNNLGAIDSQKVSVLNFSRLSDFVYREIGMISGSFIDDGVKNILMSLAIEECQDVLSIYKGQVKKPEFINLMLKTAREFKLCEVSTEDLMDKIKEINDDTLKEKIRETTTIIDVYNALVARSYLDPLDELSKVCEVLKNNDIFKDYIIYVDGFTGFTKQERNIIEQLLIQSEKITVALCGDDAEFSSSNELFMECKKTKLLISEIAKNNSVDVLKNINLNIQYRYNNQDLKTLEESIFRINSPINKEEVNNICIIENSDIYDEVNGIACQIKKLIIEYDYSYKDIAVVCRSLEDYKGILNTVFDKFKLAYFMDTSKEITSEPLAVFALSAFDIVTSSFSAENILKFLKCGLNKFTLEEISLFENYLYVWGITGNRLTIKFTANPRGYVDEFTTKDNETLQKIENIRVQIITPLVEFKEKITDTNGLEISKALYKLIEDFEVCKHLKRMTNKFTSYNYISISEEQERLWDIFVEILNKMSLILENEYLKPKRYADLLKLVISKADIFNIPSSLDEITIGTADRIRFNKPKVVFLIGALEGQFPLNPTSNGVFSDTERKLLLSLDLPLYETVEYLTLQEKYLAYYVMSAPSDYLYISYYRETLKGESVYPSVIVKDILKLNSKIKVKTDNENWLENIWCEEQGFELLIKNLKDDINAQKLYQEHFEKNTGYKLKFEAINRYLNKKEFKLQDKKISKELFNTKDMKLSASQVEKFYLCQFEYFCRYGIRASQRNKAVINSAEFGSLIHYILEQVLRKKTVVELSSSSDEDINNLLSDILNEYIKIHLGGTEEKSKRYIFMLEKMKNSSFMLLKHLIKELSQSKFTPIDFELKIGESGKISPYTLENDNVKVSVKGYVDRVDIYKNENKSYIRIVDYKTGNKTFVLSDVLFGLNLQMLIYLYAIKNDENNTYDNEVLPAGVLYMPSSSQAVNAEVNQSIEKINAEKEKTYKMNGLILNDLEVIKAMENDGKGVYIPVTFKEEKPKKTKKNDIEATEPVITIKDSGDYTVTQDGMENIFKKIDELILSMAEDLTNGSIKALPAKGNKYDACMWCEYKSVCGHNENMKYRKIVKVKGPFLSKEERQGE